MAFIVITTGSYRWLLASLSVDIVVSSRAFARCKTGEYIKYLEYVDILEFRFLIYADGWDTDQRSFPFLTAIWRSDFGRLAVL